MVEETLKGGNMKSKRGQHPNSKSNLVRGGKTYFGEKKRQVCVSITPTARRNLEALAKSYGCRSLSDWLDKVGLGKLPSP